MHRFPHSAVLSAVTILVFAGFIVGAMLFAGMPTLMALWLGLGFAGTFSIYIFGTAAERVDPLDREIERAIRQASGDYR